MKINQIVNENMSYVAYEKAQEAKRKKSKPGTDAWFKHWFSRPYMIDQRGSK